VSAALFAAMAGVSLVHVPYKGTAPAMSDLLSGQMESMVISPTIVVPYLQAGRLRALGIGGPRRQPQVADIPTLHEAGLTGFDMTCYHGLWYPARLPKLWRCRKRASIWRTTG
jgi:tripartite-type tricarboxylate transporter receptor subunit TctC